MKTAVGFNIFLEHILPYGQQAEKERMSSPPLVHLGGGAFNIVKTLESLGVNANSLRLLGFFPKKKIAQAATVSFLSGEENFDISFLPVQNEVKSSYYMLPHQGITWAFGYDGGDFIPLSKKIKSIARLEGKKAQIKILTEIGKHPAEIVLAKFFLRKYKKNQLSVLIPSQALLRYQKRQELFTLADLVAVNEQEAKILFGKELSVQKVMQFPVPYMLITRGPGEAWFKVKEKIYKAKPRVVRQPRYIGGAGDAASAALIFSFFIEKMPPEQALRFALEIGRRTLLTPKSYYVERNKISV